MLARWIGRGVQHLNTGRDQEETANFFEYEVIMSGKPELFTLRMSDFVVARGLEYGIDTMNDARATDRLFVQKFSTANANERVLDVTFHDMEILRDEGRGKVQ